ncbi:MAG: hypothetical protein ACYS15_14120 [Planctomycetota bacterium]|jgi:hypothetical protein
MLMMVRETGQSEALQATRHTVVGRPPGPAILNETEILERAAHHFRLRTQGDLDAVVGAKLGAVTEFPSANGGASGSDAGSR